MCVCLHTHTHTRARAHVTPTRLHVTQDTKATQEDVPSASAPPAPPPLPNPCRVLHPASNTLVKVQLNPLKLNPVNAESFVTLLSSPVFGVEPLEALSNLDSVSTTLLLLDDAVVVVAAVVVVVAAVVVADKQRRRISLNASSKFPAKTSAFRSGADLKEETTQRTPSF